MKTTEVVVNLERIGIFRKAKHTDVFEGNTVFLVADGDSLYRMTVDEVLNPKDDFKAFVYDGCRYGLDGLYVLISGSELQSEVERLREKLNAIKEIVNPLSVEG